VNTLSWFLYWADVIPSLVMALMVPAFIVGLVAISVIFAMTGMIWDSDRGDSSIPSMRHARRVAIVVLLIAYPIWTLCWMVPDTKTLYLIAGSQVTQQVVTTPQGQEILDAIEAKIKSVLAVEPSK
jgi:hypothetical protein